MNLTTTYMRNLPVRLYMITLYILIALLSASVFYFSWLPSPNIGSQPYFSKFFGTWINTYGNLRTAIPFLFLGFLCEFIFKTSTMVRVKVCLGLTGLVTLAEVGQLFIAERHFDVGDIGYGIAGSLLGMVFGMILKFFRRPLIK